MSSELSSIPDDGTLWQVAGIERYTQQQDLVNSYQHGEPSRTKRQRSSGATDLDDPSAASPPNRRLNRVRDDTMTSIINTRSTSKDTLLAGASQGGLLEIIGNTALAETSEPTPPPLFDLQGTSEEGDGQKSVLFSDAAREATGDGADGASGEQTGGGSEEMIATDTDAFLPITESAEVLDTRSAPLPGRITTSTATEELNDPLPISASTTSGANVEAFVQESIPRASDYIPRPFTVASAIDASVESQESTVDLGPSETLRAPRAATPVTPVEEMTSYGLTRREDEELKAWLEAGSYHSGDSCLYEMDHRPVMDRTAIKKDIREFADNMKETRDEGVYEVVDRLGEGTFSSVYLARDLDFHAHDNSSWSGTKPTDDYSLVQAKDGRPYVALKKVLATSSPARIQNELHILESLRGCRNVSQLITAFRDLDQVIIVLPYHESDDFRFFYRDMDAQHTISYMQTLLRALKDIHRRGIVHRDVKPANFLFRYEKGEGVLCDFGLAERYTPPRKAACQHSPATLEHLHGKRRSSSETAVVQQAYYDARKRAKLGEGKVGFFKEDKRGSVKTNRAGTRGFRAPEVLLKCPDQTVAIDVWSAGVMLLSILTHKFPIFNSNDDIEALMEIAAIFGRSQLEKAAFLHHRTIISNLPSLDTAPSSLRELILKLNPHIFTPPLTYPTRDEAKEHIFAMTNAIDLCTKLLYLDPTKRYTASEALRHPFFAGTDNEEDLEPDVMLSGKDGKCGDLHGYNEDDRHQAFFGQNQVDMHFGMGIPLSTDTLCPEHENLQDRSQSNPLAISNRFARDPSDTASESQGTEEPSPAKSSPPKFVREEMDRHHQRQPLQPRSLNSAAASAASVKHRAVASLDAAHESSKIGMGLSRFVGRDKEDIAIRAGAKRGLY